MRPNQELIKELRRKKLHVGYEVGSYLNISRRDGLNCEFYPCGKNDEFFCATYTLDGKERDLDFYLPDDLTDFVDAVCKILEVPND